MKAFSYKQIPALLAVLLLLLSIGSAQAQFEMKWLGVGTMQSPYSEGGALREQEPFDNAGIQYPAIDYNGGNVRAYGLWVGATNFTDETGRVFPHKIAHIGPRSGGAVQFYPTTAEVIAKFDTQVLVDGAQSFLRYVFIDGFDPSMRADRMAHIVNNNRVGIEMDLKAYAFSQEFHDSYHIIEYTFTNTGNVDSDPAIELNQPLTGVYFFFINRHALHGAASWITGNGAPWGKFAMNDAVGDGHEDYGVDFRAQYSWYGYSVFQTEFNSLGGPMWLESADWSAPIADTTGRLAAAHMVGRLYLHADRSATDETDDPLQPATMGVKGSDDPDLVDDEYRADLMQRQYDNFMRLGRQYPHHAQLIEPTREYDKPRNDPASAFGRYDEGGWAFVEGFGPYTLQPGENVKIVVAEGASGLSAEAKLAIGQAYKRAGANKDNALFTFAGQQLTKNQWVMSSKDSLFQVFRRARANYNAGFNIPEPPRPPERFAVTSGVGRITLEWQTFAGAAQTGWEIYRKQGQFYDTYDYTRIATLPGDARRYEDQSAQRGIDYYYYLQAVGAVNTNPEGNTPVGVALKSGRYYTQTYLPANLKRPPGTSPSQIRVVPNPFNLASNESLRWPDQDDKLGFLDIPGSCTIKIYSQLGELIHTIEHTDGSGDAYWDHTTDSRQVVASGIYVAVIENLDNGQKTFKKFVIIR
ncbi:MAG: hypothetical protein ACREOO_05775 [bacterium]